MLPNWEQAKKVPLAVALHEDFERAAAALHGRCDLGRLFVVARPADPGAGVLPVQINSSKRVIFVRSTSSFLLAGSLMKSFDTLVSLVGGRGQDSNLRS